MRILVDHLRRYIDLPAGTREVRALLDDVGIEVKRVHETAHGTVFTVELLANRGDHYCYAGIAREVSGRTGAPLKLPDILPLEIGAPPVPVEVETEACLVYTLTRLERTDAPGAPLPKGIIEALEAAEVGIGLDVVNATNLANLELGQPTHAFDEEKVDGAIVIRRSRKGEKALPLFATAPVELPEGTLVIADRKKVLAVAGVIGCEESKVTAATRKVLLESATFEPGEVRKASRALSIATDSAARFMRGGDPALPLGGAGRVARLLLQTGAWRVAGTTGKAGAWTDPARVIELDPPATSAFVGHRFTADEIASRLARYGFASVAASAPGRVAVRVPTVRLWDIETAFDLYEELANSVGYNAVDSIAPVAAIGSLPTHAETVRDAVNEVLVGEGFYEVFTDGFYSKAARAKLGIAETHPLFDHVETVNAVDREYTLLKNNTLIQALEAVVTNLHVKNPEVKAYEWTRTFHPDPAAENKVCSERPVLWAVASGLDRPPGWRDKGRPADALFMKGVLEQLRLALRVDLALGPAEGHPLAVFLHPERCAGILHGGKLVGILGEVHPGPLASFKIKRARPAFLEVEVGALEAPPLPRRYVDPATLLPVTRDLTFELPPRVEAASVAERLRAAAPAHLDGVRVTDLFELEREGTALRAVTFQLEFSQDKAGATLTVDDLNASVAAMVDAVHGALGARGVKQRA
jgi:phenylalanyl-tRNA synthetase beta chain